MDFLVRNGYMSAGDITFEETEEEGQESELKMMANVVVKKMDEVGKKMDELIEIGRNVFVALVIVIAALFYFAVSK